MNVQVRFGGAAPGLRAALRSERPDLAPLVFGALPELFSG